MQNAKEYIDKTRDGLIAATQGLPEAQWNFKSSPESWSIAEILEHIVMTQELVLGPVRARLADAPPAPADHDPEQVDALIVDAFPSRVFKFKGPEVLTPTGHWAPSESLGRFNGNCVRYKEYLDSTAGLRQHAVDSLPLKAISNGRFQFMDGYQWVLAIAAHTARHTSQIMEVKADPGFPADRQAQASVA